MRRRGASSAGKNEPVRTLRDLHRQVAGGGRDELVAGAVALGRAGLAALVQTGADAGGRLGVDDGLEHPAQEPAHELAAVGGAEHLEHLEQGRIVQGHRVKSLSVSSLAGSHRASRGGPSTTVTDTKPVTIKSPSYTTPGDSAPGASCSSPVTTR